MQNSLRKLSVNGVFKVAVKILNAAWLCEPCFFFARNLHFLSYRYISRKVFVPCELNLSVLC